LSAHRLSSPTPATSAVTPPTRLFTTSAAFHCVRTSHRGKTSTPERTRSEPDFGTVSEPMRRRFSWPGTVRGARPGECSFVRVGCATRAPPRVLPPCPAARSGSRSLEKRTHPSPRVCLRGASFPVCRSPVRRKEDVFGHRRAKRHPCVRIEEEGAVLRAAGCELAGATRRDVRPPRAQRRRQVDVDQDLVDFVAAHVGYG